MTLEHENTADISVATLTRIDVVCLKFEHAWRSGELPKIEEYLVEVDQQLYPPLISELLLLDIDYRQQKGEHPQASDYHTQLPGHGSTIESVFLHHQAIRPSDGTLHQGLFTATAAPPIPLEPPPQFGRYRTIRKLGAGGFGSVYLAHDDDLQRDVAVKFPHGNRQRLHFDTDRFLEEARVLATLSHPAIVPVFDVGRLDDDPRVCFVVSQLMNGGDLDEYLVENRPSIESAVGIVVRLSHALHYAHGRGLVHRDVKTSNILRDANGDVYISDFGSAIRDSALDHEIGFAGTPAYMSPEQARGEAHLVDGRTDVYSLGVVFYELLTGVRPFKSNTMTKLLEKIQIRDPKPLRQIDDSIPRELERICLKALSKQPADRYSTAGDLAEELQNWQKASAPAENRDRSPGILRQTVIAAIVAVALLAVVALILHRTSSSPVPVTINSLAVLPFQQLDADPNDKYLGLGITDALITRLSNIRQLKVRPTGSIRQFVDSTADPLSSGRELRVDAVLEGTIQRVADKTRATVRLLRVSDGKSLWAGTFTEASNDLFAVQDAISERVAGVLAPKLSSEERARLNRRQTESPEAQAAYIKGRYHWNQRAIDSRVDQAIKFYKQAIDHDPLFALAYAGLAESYVLMNVYEYDQTESAIPMGKAAAEQALALDSGLTEAIATLAYAKFYYDFDWDGAEKEFLRAIELNPNYATAHQWYGEYLYFRGRFDEAIVEIELAGELDPLSSVIRSIRGSPYLFRGDYERAREEYLKALELYPTSGVALYGLATCYEQQSRTDDALRVYGQMDSPPVTVSAYGQAGSAFVYAVSGEQTKARRILKEMLSSPGPKNVSPYLIATVYAGLGESELSIDWLQSAFQQRDDQIVWVNVDPKLNSLRANARFIDFLSKLENAKNK